MIKTFYIQIDERNIVRDVISFQHEDYKEIQLQTPLPPLMLSGCYKLLDGGIVYVPELDNSELQNKISILEAENKALKEINTEQDNLIVDNAYKIAILELGGM